MTQQDQEYTIWGMITINKKCHFEEIKFPARLHPLLYMTVVYCIPYTTLYMDEYSNSSKRVKIVPESPKWPMLGHLFGLSSSETTNSLKDAGCPSWTWCFWFCALRCSAFHSKGRRMWWQLQHTSGPRRYASLHWNCSQNCIKQLAMKPQRMKHKRGHRMAVQIHRIPLIKLNLGTKLGPSATPWQGTMDAPH